LNKALALNPDARLASVAGDLVNLAGAGCFAGHHLLALTLDA